MRAIFLLAIFVLCAPAARGLEPTLCDQRLFEFFDRREHGLDGAFARHRRSKDAPALRRFFSQLLEVEAPQLYEAWRQEGIELPLEDLRRAIAAARAWAGTGAGLAPGAGLARPAAMPGNARLKGWRERLDRISAPADGGALFDGDGKTAAESATQPHAGFSPAFGPSITVLKGEGRTDAAQKSFKIDGVMARIPLLFGKEGGGLGLELGYVRSDPGPQTRRIPIRQGGEQLGVVVQEIVDSSGHEILGAYLRTPEFFFRRVSVDAGVRVLQYAYRAKETVLTKEAPVLPGAPRFDSSYEVAKPSGIRFPYYLGAQAALTRHLGLRYEFNILGIDRFGDLDWSYYPDRYDPEHMKEYLSHRVGVTWTFGAPRKRPP